LARRVAVNSACRFNRVQLVAGSQTSRTVNIIKLYIVRHYLNITSRDIYGTIYGTIYGPTGLTASD